MLRHAFILALVATAAHAGGLLARLAQPGASDALALPQAAFYFPAGSPPTRFLRDGLWTIDLTGSVSIDLRAQYEFQVEASGPGQLSINGKTILEFNDGLSPLSARVRLSKGTNALAVHLSIPAGRPAQFRLLWKSRDMAQPIPIPHSALSFDDQDPLLRAQSQLRTGLVALEEFRCVQCHGNAPPDAPQLTGIGSRLREAWMADWIGAPAKLRPAAHMPALVSTEDARAIAAYLATLSSTPAHHADAGPVPGENLFTQLQCTKCHDREGKSPAQWPLHDLAAKYQPHALANYLLDPQAHYPGNPMPNFKLTPGEASSLAAFLTGGTTERSSHTPSSNTRGRDLVETRGCLNCHQLDGANRFQALPFARFRHFQGGCLDPENQQTPRFNLTPETRAALIHALEKGIAHAAPESDLSFALRQTATLRCAECHNTADGVIRLEMIGGKLRPEWVEQFLLGQVPYKPRPWLPARMPSFPAPAHRLAAGLAALHGVPPVTPEEPPVDPALASAGAQLISAAGGFSCVACHAVGSATGSGIVESPGVNLAYSGDRLLKSFFHRWVMNPLALDPATKMPVYFDESGHSQLIDFFDGNGPRQIEAIWQYVRLGDRMPAPPMP